MMITESLGNSLPVGPVVTPPLRANVEAGGADKTSFGDMLKTFMKDVNHMQNKAGDSIQKLLAGEINDPHQVMLAVGEAKMALNLLLEIRNKVMDGYKEVMAIRMG